MAHLPFLNWETVGPLTYAGWSLTRPKVYTQNHRTSSTISPSRQTHKVTCPRTNPLDFAIITDAGPVQFGTESAFAPHYTLFTCPPGLGRNCAILVRSHIATVRKPHHDPSGRALAVDVVPEAGGSRYVRLVALYQHPGLDYIAPAPPGAQVPTFDSSLAGARSVPRGARRMEAERLRRTVLRWRSDKRVGCTILGSDSNETVLGALDRQTTSEGRPGKERAGTIHAMLDDDAWCDWYRRCHPVPLDDLLDLPMTTRGHTYFDPGGGSSRIDYVMIYPAPKTAGTCMVDTSWSHRLVGAGAGRRATHPLRR